MVYPRVGGGNAYYLVYHRQGAGLSPRGRGKLHIRRRVMSVCGSIPAWAGETSQTGHSQNWRGVYPRVGGGNASAFGRTYCPSGLSPRGRGKLIFSSTARLSSGSIPAWAGETFGFHRRALGVRVYPRVGGGNFMQGVNSVNNAGLSPRGRGKRKRAHHPSQHCGSIPAWAGETQQYRNRNAVGAVYPRVGGGNSTAR